MCKYKHLPQGWKVKKLEEIKTIEFLRGNGLPKSALNDSGKSECIHYGQLYTTYKHPVIKKVVFRTNIEGKRLSNKGDVLIPGTTTADAMGIAIARSLNVNNVVIGGDINILRTKNMDIFSDFLSYYLNGPAKVELASYANGTNILHLSNKKIKKILIPIPSLSEQKRIVVILDKIFAEITKAEAIAKTNLQNAKELFESYLNNVFEDKGDDWEEKTLGEIVYFFNGFAFKSKNAIDFSNTQVVRMGNLYQNKLNLDRKSAFYPEHFAVDYEKYLLRENDLIISLTGTAGKEDYGYTVSIPKTEKNLLLNQRIAKIIIKDKNIIERGFLFHFLLSGTFLGELYKIANGTRQANLSTETMKKLQISCPPLKKQKQIVQKLNNLSIQTKKLEVIYQQKIIDLSELKKSILQKAFNGEL